MNDSTIRTCKNGCLLTLRAADDVDLDEDVWAGFQMCPLHEAAPEMLEALRPFAYLAKVLTEGEMLNFRGVFVGHPEAQTAAELIARIEGEA